MGLIYFLVVFFTYNDRPGSLIQQSIALDIWIFFYHISYNSETVLKTVQQKPRNENAMLSWKTSITRSNFVYTRKNAHVATCLQTSCYTTLFTSFVLALLVPGCCNKLGTSCSRLVTSFYAYIYVCPNLNQVQFTPIKRGKI